MSKGFKHGGGGGADPLNFKIVGGDTAPGSPKDNMIWVNTSTKISSWSISNVEPDSPVPGMVWVKVALSGKIQFNALKKNVLTIYPAAVQQYESDAWVRRDAKIHQGEWVEFGALYIYNNGEATGYTMACDTALKQMSSGYTAESAYVTVNSTDITVKNGANTYAFTNIFAADGSGGFVKIDLSEYKTLRVKGTVTNAKKDTACVFRALTDMGELCTQNNALSQPIYSGDLDLAIDVSAINSSCYLGFTFYNDNNGQVTLQLTELSLE